MNYELLTLTVCRCRCRWHRTLFHPFQGLAGFPVNSLANLSSLISYIRNRVNRTNLSRIESFFPVI